MRLTVMDLDLVHTAAMDLINFVQADAVGKALAVDVQPGHVAHRHVPGGDGGVRG
jgi:hypothetical protein